MAERLLVTGATGLVGRHVVQAALDQGRVVVAVTSDPARAGAVAGADWRAADLLAPGAAGRLIQEVRPTRVVHAAWDTRHGIYWNSESNRDWLAATAAMAREFGRAGGRRFVLAGTCAEYDWSAGEMVEGETPERPHTLYGRCKLAAHHAVQEAAEAGGFSAVTARVFFCYGPFENPQRLIPYACRTLAAGGTPRLTSGRQVRDLLHAEDAASALLALADSDLGGAVNLGSGAPTPLSRVARILAEAAGAPERAGLGSAPDRPDDPPVLVPRVERLFGLGWRPRRTLEDGLRTTYAWWAERADSAGDRAAPS